MFVFSGRSRRTEVIAFFVLGTIANLFSLEGRDEDLLIKVIHAGWSFLWGFPWVALLVRRLHDQGRSALWAGVLMTMFVTLTASSVMLPQSPDGGYRVTFLLWTFHPVGPLGIIFGVAEMICALIALYLYLAPEQWGPNRYGPDPRVDPEDAEFAAE